jgi:hypothetical protein
MKLACAESSSRPTLPTGTGRSALPFVDQLDPVPVTAPEDLPEVRTVGVALSLPEPENAADEDAVQRDVAALVESMSDLTRGAGIEFAVKYREEAIGFLDGGPSDARVLADFFGDP